MNKSGRPDTGSSATGRLQEQVRRLLLDRGAGDKQALDRLFPLIYDELRQIARRHLRGERHDHTLNTTALVHESYLNLVGQTQMSVSDRAHFLAVASTAMRHILIDHARRRRAQKRGGDRIQVSLSDAAVEMADQTTELLALDQALTELSERSPRLGQVVECRVFGGLTVRETAEALSVSPRTVERDWTRAKAYLYRALQPVASGDAP